SCSTSVPPPTTVSSWNCSPPSAGWGESGDETGNSPHMKRMHLAVCARCAVRGSLQAEQRSDLRAVADDDAGEDDRHNADELDENIQRRAGRVLEGIARLVADDGSLVMLRTLAAQFTGFDILLGVVPRAAGVGHEDGDGKAGHERPGE